MSSRHGQAPLTGEPAIGTLEKLTPENPRSAGSAMNIGVYWSTAVLAHKRERRDQPGVIEEVWNCRRLPRGLGQDPCDRLVVACNGYWCGGFLLAPEILYSPDDPACPYALIFDVKSWIELIEPPPCKRFRGWTYKVPRSIFP